MTWQKIQYIQKIKVILQQVSIAKATPDNKVPGYLEYVTNFLKVHSFDFLIYDLFIFALFTAGVILVQKVKLVSISRII